MNADVASRQPTAASRSSIDPRVPAFECRPAIYNWESKRA